MSATVILDTERDRVIRECGADTDLVQTMTRLGQHLAAKTA